MVGKGVFAFWCLLVVTSSLLTGFPAQAASLWTGQIFGGSAYNFKTPLRIQQDGEAEIKLNARYETRAFDNAPYYVLRLGRKIGEAIWELEHIHHKIFLKNKPAEVDHFQIEHGYNLFTFNRAWMRYGLFYRIGAGIAVTRPLTTIRGKKSLPDGSGFFSAYRITGGGIQMGVEKRMYLGERFFIALEGKLTAAWVRIRINAGKASVPNVALHGLLGFGADF